MGKSESKHCKIDSKILALEVEDQVNLETMDNEGIPMLSNDNYHQWKENINSNIMNHVVWYLVCNSYTKIPPPSNEEVKKNSKVISDIINNIPNSKLNRFMNSTIANQVWDKLQEIHEEKRKEGCSLEELPSNRIANNVSKHEHDKKTTFVMSIANSKEDMLEEISFLS